MALRRISETVVVKRETKHVGATVILMFSMIASVFCMDISISMECRVILLARI